MPVKLTALLGERAEVKVDVAGETLTVGYRPGAYTSRFLEEATTLHQQLARLICDWDLLDEKGKPYPIEEKALEELPLPLLRRILDAVSEDLFPNPRKSASSGSFS